MAKKPTVKLNPKGLLKNVVKRKSKMDKMMKDIEAGGGMGKPAKKKGK